MVREGRMSPGRKSTRNARQVFRECRVMPGPGLWYGWDEDGEWACVIQV